MVATVGLVAWGRPDLSTVGDDPEHLGLFVAALVLANVLNVGGLLILTGTVARHAAGPRPAGRIAQLRAYGSLRHWGDDVLFRASQDRLFRLGFSVNWVGAAAAAIIPALAILVLLPVEAWGLLVICVVDIASTMVIRLALRGRVRRVHASRADDLASAGPPAPLS